MTDKELEILLENDKYDLIWHKIKSTRQIIKYRKELGWDIIISNIQIPVNVFLQYIDEILNKDILLVYDYVMRNRMIPLDDLLKIREKVLLNHGNYMDDVIIFNKNMTREIYDNLIFDMDCETYTSFEYLNGKNINNSLRHYSFSEKVLNQYYDKKYMRDYLTYQKLSEDFILKHIDDIKFTEPNLIENFILNNLPDFDFLKEYIFPIIGNYTKKLDSTYYDNESKKYVEKLNCLLKKENEYYD